MRPRSRGVTSDEGRGSGVERPRRIIVPDRSGALQVSLFEASKAPPGAEDTPSQATNDSRRVAFDATSKGSHQKHPLIVPMLTYVFLKCAIQFINAGQSQNHFQVI